MRKMYYSALRKMKFSLKECQLFFLPVLLLLQLTAVQSQTPPGLITNVTSTTGRPYTLGQLAVGATIYSDRAYQATSVPAFLNNAAQIKTPNDDKANKGTTTLSFDVTQSATVYVAYDPRATILPAWLSGWEKLTSQIGINDPKITYLELFKKDFPAGKVTLGGNLASPAAGALNEYLVAALPQAQGTQYNLTVNSSGNGSVTKNPDQASYPSGAVVGLTAVPASGQQFTGWSGNASGITNPLNVTMDADKSVTASFAPVTVGQATVVPLQIYDNDVSGGAPGISRSITVTNSGSGVLSISAINTSGANAGHYVLSGLPAFPKDLNPGSSVSFSVAFNPSSTGLKTATVNINSNDPAKPTVSVPLRALGTPGTGGVNEPSLQAILNLLEVQTDAGDDDVATAVINSNATSQKAPLLGDEVSIQRFQKAGAGNVSITPLAVFGPTDNATVVALGWYKSGDASSLSEMLSVSNAPVSNGQTVNVNFTGSLVFDPATEPFGFYSRWPYFNNRHLYSEDALNTFSGSVPHHVRIYPYKKNGVMIQNSYVVAFEEHISGFDYQDIVFLVSNVKKAPGVPQDKVALIPVADAFVRNGTYATTNYGADTSLVIKGSTQSGLTRFSYLKFPLTSLPAAGKVNSAILRLYGRNTENTASVNHSVSGVDDDSWTENGINFNNAPATSNPPLSTLGVNSEMKYYEFDVTSYVKSQFAGDKIVSFIIKDLTNTNKNIAFNSKEKGQNPPELIVDTLNLAPSNALLFIENPDKFPANDHFVFSKVQKPWSRDSVNYNSNHDSLKVRIHNKGIDPLVVSNLTLSNGATWMIDKINTTPYESGSGLPVSIASGGFIDVTLKFIATEQATRVKILHETFKITSNDSRFPVKTIFLHGIWQRSGEGSREPTAQEIIDAFGFKSQTGFPVYDPDQGDSTKLKGDEIKPSFFVQADLSMPITARQMSAYHGCCTSTEKLYWYPKGTTTLNAIYTHIAKDGQSVLPRQSNGSVANGTFAPSSAFGFKIGYVDLTDAAKNPGKKIGIRVWKAINAAGAVIPNTYIIANDYLGSSFTNYDYNDNTHYVTNIKPYTGSVFFSELSVTPSALDFGEKVLETNTALTLPVKSLGKTYSNGSSDPVINITSVQITGENSLEFSYDLPLDSALNPQETSSITVRFKPLTQGLKIADLLIYHNNSPIPLRVPLYGIAKATGISVTVHNRIAGGRSASVTINGKTWSGDTPFAFDNLEPFKNNGLTQIAATDDDALYLTEQSSNGDKKPFRYQIPVANGEYIVRLHFAEIYWGAPGAGATSGAGSRVFSVKLENQYRLINFDMVQEAGSASAVIKNFPVTVTDGKINIDFSATVNRPMISAVEVYSFSASGARPAVVAASSVALPPVFKEEIAGPDFNTPRVFPNPLVTPQFTIQFPAKYQGIFSLQLIDPIGRKYSLGKTRLNGSGANMKINLAGLSLRPGLYYVRINSTAKKTDVLKLLIK